MNFSALFNPAKTPQVPLTIPNKCTARSWIVKGYLPKVEHLEIVGKACLLEVD